MTEQIAGRSPPLSQDELCRERLFRTPGLLCIRSSTAVRSLHELHDVYFGAIEGSSSVSVSGLRHYIAGNLFKIFGETHFQPSWL